MTTTTEVTGELIAASGPLDIEAIRRMADDAGTSVEPATIKALGIDGTFPILIDRKSGQAKSLKPLFEEYRDRPARKSGIAKVFTLDSFIALTNRHKTVESVIFADTNWRQPSLTTVVDYHTKDPAGPPDNGKHRVHYEFPLSDEWDAWIKLDGQQMDQKAFAEWIEEHLPELAAPTADEVDELEKTFNMTVASPNKMVMLSRGLQVNVESRVKNSTTLQSGEGELLFEEEHRDAAGNKLSVPGLFILAIPPFFMGEPVRMPVRLRYRVNSGQVKWMFKIFRPDVYITTQIEADLARAAEATDLPHFRGKPEMSA
jgi:uncharacterized protein YfdQ (DUF2303 family)